jgi:Diguanylate cyclase, GGDEF domain
MHRQTFSQENPLPASPAGSYQTVSIPDQVERLLRYQQVGNHPLLGSIAACIAGRAKRASDLCARHGGEEFAVLLPGETVESAFRIAEKIRLSVLSLRAQQQGRPDMSPTVSVVVAAMTPQAGLARHDLIRSADLALYEAKHGGRDRSVAAPIFAASRNKLAAWFGHHPKTAICRTKPLWRRCDEEEYSCRVRQITSSARRPAAAPLQAHAAGIASLIFPRAKSPHDVCPGP